MTRIRLSARLLIAALVVTASASLPSVASADPPAPCVEWGAGGFCVEWEVPVPGTPGQPGTPGDGGGNTPVCYWRNTIDLTNQGVDFYVDFGIPIPPVGVEIQWQEWYCSDGSSADDYRWVIVDEPPTPGELAGVARGRLAGLMPAPAVDSSPPAGVASIVGLPVFVAVSNWTGLLTDSECAGGLCVTVTATPSLEFDPGEPDAPTKACAGAGSRFDPARPVDEQIAAPDACAWPYTLRTGVEGRPVVWAGSVAVSWSISWTATSGASGSLPAVTRSAPVPRAVAEVQTVVVGGVTP